MTDNTSNQPPAENDHAHLTEVCSACRSYLRGKQGGKCIFDKRDNRPPSARCHYVPSRWKSKHK